jgi:hypothetical protein
MAVLWPARLAGPLDGAPLDGRLEALVIGLALPAALAIDRRALRSRTVRVAISALLSWKALLVGSTVPDGWCVRFTSPIPLFVDNVTVPHAWDVRADWLSGVPRCSAVMTRAYDSQLHFPVWFYNLPPANWGEPAVERERPPHTSVAIDVSGALAVSRDGVFRVLSDDGVALSATIDGTTVAGDALASGVRLGRGSHAVVLNGRLTGDRWRLVPQWDGEDVWRSTVATMGPAGAGARALRPWGAWLTALLVTALAAAVATHLARRVADWRIMTAMLALSLVGAAASLGRDVWMRLAPAVSLTGLSLRWPRRL